MQLRVLGPLELWRNGEAVDIRSRKQRAVLTILLIDADHVVSADRISDLLWNGESPEHAQATLQTYIAHLRRSLEPERAPRGQSAVLVSVPPGYRMNTASLELDSYRFESLTDEARTKRGVDDQGALDLLTEGLSLWRGPAFAEFAAEPFALAAANRLEALRLGAFEERAEVLLALGETANAVAELEAHVTGHPLREQARSLLALAMYRAGRQADALAVLSEGRRILRDELGLDPGPDLRRLEQQILDHDPTLLGPPPTRAGSGSGPTKQPRPLRREQSERPDQPENSHVRTPFVVGRSIELEQLEACVAEAARGRGSVVLLSGDAGVGKSTLLESLRWQVAAQGGSVRWARCQGGVTAPPFWPIVQLVREAAPELDDGRRRRLNRLLAPLGDLFPDLIEGDGNTFGGFDPGLVRLQMFEAFMSVLRDSGRTSATGSVSMVVLDDLHLADPATLQLVAALAATVHTENMIVATAVRSGEADDYLELIDALAALGAAPRALRLELGPLGEAAMNALIQADAASALADDDVAWVTERAEGNPFFGLELARLARSERPSLDGSIADGRERSVRRGVPTGIAQVLQRRFLRLSAASLRLLTAAAVVGSPFDPDEIASIEGVEPRDALDVFDAALSSRLVVDAGRGRYAFAHALVADLLRSSLSSARLARLHQSAATSLVTRRGNDPEWATVIAQHFVEASSLDHGEAALPWLAQASSHALRASSLSQVRQINSQIIALLESYSSPRDERHELRALSRLAYADVWEVGYGSPLVRAFARRVDRWQAIGPPEVGDADILWSTAVFQTQFGRVDDADRTVGRLAQLHEAFDDVTVAYLHHDIEGCIRWLQGRFEESLEHSSRAEAIVASGRLDLRDTLVVSPVTRVAAMKAMSLWHLGRRDEALHESRRAIAMSEGGGADANSFARRWALLLSVMDNDINGVETLVRLELGDGQWDQFVYPSAVVQFASGWLHARTRDAHQGLSLMESAHAALEAQSQHATRSLMLGVMAEVAVVAGAPDMAAAFCESAIALSVRGESYWLPELHRVAALAFEASGDTGAATLSRAEGLHLAEARGDLALLARFRGGGASDR